LVLEILEDKDFFSKTITLFRGLGQKVKGQGHRAD